MRLVVLTGGIATGKTTVGNILKENHIPILDSDKIAHEVELPTGAAYPKIVEHFGKKILSPDGTINRKALGAIVFTQEKERRILNGIVHPLVIKTLFLRGIKLWFSGEPIIILIFHYFLKVIFLILSLMILLQFHVLLKLNDKDYVLEIIFLVKKQIKE